jgi:hypothetical protein
MKDVDTENTTMTVGDDLVNKDFTEIKVVNGTEYVMTLSFYNVSLDLHNLEQFVRQLPRLETFMCYHCSTGGQLLPAGLPAAAPGVRRLVFEDCGMSGPLPAAWGTWSSLQKLEFYRNRITGTLPESFAALRRLVFLDLRYNKLQGTLPALWGHAQRMRTDLYCDFGENTDLHGTVPSAWSYFSHGLLGVQGTGITGCLFAESQVHDCLESPDASLLALKQMIRSKTAGKSDGLSTWTNGARETCSDMHINHYVCCVLTNLRNKCTLCLDKCNQTAPCSINKFALVIAEDGAKACHEEWSDSVSWVGISCNDEGRVIQLNLTALNITLREGASLPFLGVLAAIRNMTHTQSLVLSGVGLSGPLDEAEQIGLETFQDLHHLDISNNHGITGTLPSRWYALAALQSLNVSNSGLSGTLPAVYAALQQLREFRAVNCSSLTGQLPHAWGLLNLQLLEITNSGLTGELPREWADAAALRQAGPAMASKMYFNGEADEVSPQNRAERDVVMQALQKPATLGGLQQLRVLDLSVSITNTGKMYGPLPDSFATMGQLQVSSIGDVSVKAEQT